MVSNSSKWKNVFGEINKQGSFDDVNPRTTISSDGSLIDVSPEFVAVNWLTSGGGAVGVLKSTNFIRVPSSFPLIFGHTSIVSDIKFSPTNPFLLATGSDDGKVKLWTIPEEGLTQDLTNETQVLIGHKKKVSLLAWNPTLNEVLASVGNNHDILIHDVINSKELFSIKSDDNSFNLEWDRNGALLGTLLKNKTIKIYDPRNPNSEALSTNAHDTPKIQKMGFADQDYIFSSGHNSKGYRELKLYDKRNFGTEIQHHKVDTLQGMFSHYYDEDLGIIYLHGKGEGIITFAEIKEGSIKEGNKFVGSSQFSGVSFFPKRTMDYNNCELGRAATLSKDKINYVSFKYPRRNQGFDEDFYPACYTGEASISLDEWLNGVSKNQPRKSVTQIDNKFKHEPVVFNKKIEEPRKSVTFESLENENSELKKKISELEEQIKDLKTKIN